MLCVQSLNKCGRYIAFIIFSLCLQWLYFALQPCMPALSFSRITSIAAKQSGGNSIPVGRWSTTAAIMCCRATAMPLHPPGMLTWTNYTFKSKVKLNDSGSAVHLNYRGSCERYFIGFSSTSLYLAKTRPCGTHPSLVSLYEPHAAGRWYAVEITGREGSIKVYVDGVLKIDHIDSDPVLSGPISFETLTASTVYIDEVVVDHR